MVRGSKTSRGCLLVFVCASLFLIPFGVASHSAFADLLIVLPPTTQSMSGIGASPDSDVVFLSEVGCFNLLIAKGDLAQMWHSCLHGP